MPYMVCHIELLVTGGKIVNGMVWEDFNIAISNQIFAFVFVFFFSGGFVESCISCGN